MVETQNFRFIPAGAGNTAPLKICTKAIAVYPRWRGEHWQNKHRGTRGAGLSPLARGTLDQAVLFFQRRRFIPAGAGNTQKQNTETAVPAVYPRWRGEHALMTLRQRWQPGLSPLARGTHTAGIPHQRKSRFIPAGAGNTFPRRLQMGHSPVYPRWRGEHNNIHRIGSSATGLSPLARGTHIKNECTQKRERFIPAGAGNTWRYREMSRSLAVYPRWRGEHSKHNLLLINDFLSQSQSTNFIVSHKQHIHYVKEYLIH